jgi:hypothetical protein
MKKIRDWVLTNSIPDILIAGRGSILSYILFTFGKGPVHLDIGTGFVYASFKFIIVN